MVDREEQPWLTTEQVLDKGFVTLCDWMGDDLSPVNAARVSFNKQSKKFSVADGKLIAYLAKNGHTSPFRHTALTFEIQAPMMVARQWFKYRIGSAHTDDNFELLGLGNGDDGGESLDDARNESSRRYVTEEPLFHVPTTWRSTPDSKKQGSGGPITDGLTLRWLAYELEETQRKGRDLYESAMDAGVCAEQARLFLPAYGLYLHWRWTCNLASVAHFLNQRLDSHAQVEIQQYAQAVYRLTELRFPLSLKALVNE